MKKVTHCYVGNYLVSILPPLKIVCNAFMVIGTYPLMFIGMVYNNIMINLKNYKVNSSA